MAGPGPGVCVMPRPGLQALLMAAGVVLHFAGESPPAVLVADVRHERTLRRMFAGERGVRFWFKQDGAEARALAMGMRVVRLLEDPVRAYAAAGVAVGRMHAACERWRDAEREQAVTGRVVDACGPTFVLVHGAIGSPLLPEGVPVVRTDALLGAEPLDLCGLIEAASQVHAPDSWLLTLADMLGGSGAKFCHAYASSAPLAVCRRKYRRRVHMVAGDGHSATTSSPVLSEASANVFASKSGYCAGTSIGEIVIAGPESGPARYERR